MCAYGSNQEQHILLPDGVKESFATGAKSKERKERKNACQTDMYAITGTLQTYLLTRWMVWH